MQRFFLTLIITHACKYHSSHVYIHITWSMHKTCTKTSLKTGIKSLCNYNNGNFWMCCLAQKCSNKKKWMYSGFIMRFPKRRVIATEFKWNVLRFYKCPHRMKVLHFLFGSVQVQINCFTWNEVRCTCSMVGKIFQHITVGYKLWSSSSMDYEIVQWCFPKHFPLKSNLKAAMNVKHGNNMR